MCGASSAVIGMYARGSGSDHGEMNDGRMRVKPRSSIASARFRAPRRTNAGYQGKRVACHVLAGAKRSLDGPRSTTEYTGLCRSYRACEVSSPAVHLFPGDVRQIVTRPCVTRAREGTTAPVFCTNALPLGDERTRQQRRITLLLHAAFRQHGSVRTLAPIQGDSRDETIRETEKVSHDIATGPLTARPRTSWRPAGARDRRPGDRRDGPTCMPTL